MDTSTLSSNAEHISYLSPAVAALAIMLAFVGMVGGFVDHLTTGGTVPRGVRHRSLALCALAVVGAFGPLVLSSWWLYGCSALALATALAWSGVVHDRFEARLRSTARGAVFSGPVLVPTHRVTDPYAA